MGALKETPVKLRKTPAQARSAATVEAIFEATVQVLLAEGSDYLTTTRVAHRAGVSVGTLYQYFPHKQALLYAVLEQLMEGVHAAVAKVCVQHRGDEIETIAAALVKAFADYIEVNFNRAVAMQFLINDPSSASLLGGVMDRIHLDVSELLKSARDAVFDDALAVSFILIGAIMGVLRALARHGWSAKSFLLLRKQLAILATSYLSSFAI